MKETLVPAKRGSSPRQPLTSVERVYAFVRQGIKDFTLKPGQSIVDSDIAKQVGISRTPVREALRQLELEGLVVHTPRRGWTVRVLQLKDVENIFEIKECLEGMLVRQATRKLNPQDKVALKKIFRTMEEAANARDRHAWLAADARLEKAFYVAAGNPRAQQILSSVNAQWHWVWLGIIALGDRMEQSTREHGAILDRALVGDADGAVGLALEHLASIKRLLLTVLTHFVFPLTETVGGAVVVPAARKGRAKASALAS